MTRSEIRQSIRDLIDEQYAGFWPDAQLNRYINIAYNELVTEILAANANYFLTSSTISTVAGTWTVALPTDCMRVARIYDSDNNVLQPMNRREMDPSTSGTPDRFDIYGTNLYMYPKPDGVASYTIEYYALPADITSDLTTPSLPIGYHDTLVYGAAKLAIMKEGIADASVAMQYEQRKHRMLQHITERQDFEPRRVRTGMGNFGEADL